MSVCVCADAVPLSPRAVLQYRSLCERAEKIRIIMVVTAELDIFFKSIRNLAGGENRSQTDGRTLNALAVL